MTTSIRSCPRTPTGLAEKPVETKRAAWFKAHAPRSSGACFPYATLEFSHERKQSFINEIRRCWLTLGLTFIATRAGRFAVPRNARPQGTHVTLRIAARDVALATAKPEGISIRNIFEANIEQMFRTGQSTVRVALRCGDGRLVSEVTEDSVARLKLETGGRVFALVKAAALVRNSSERAAQ